MLEKKSIRRVHLLEIILLILRTIIVLLIVLMISRPVISGIFAGWVDNPSSTITAILIDDSFSMSGEIESKSFEDRIKKIVYDINSTLDKRQIVILGTISKGILFFGDGQTYLEMKPDISQTFNTGEFGNLFNSILDTIQTDFVNKEMYVISDFASNTFNFTNDLSKRLESWNIFTIPMRNPIENVVIMDVDVENEIIVPNQQIKISVKVKNTGSIQQRSKMLTLAVNGLDVAQQIVNLEIGEQKTYSFKTALPKPGNYNSEVYLENDDQVGGNTHHFVLSIPENIAIGILSSNLQDINYLTNAFDALNNSEHILSYTLKDPQVVLEMDLQKYDIILYNGFWSKEVIEKFNSYINNGKHLVILPGQNLKENEFLSVSMDCPEFELGESFEFYKEFHPEFKIAGKEQSVSHLLNLSQTKPRFFKNCSLSGNGSEHLVLEDGSVVWIRKFIHQSILDFIGFQFKPDWTNLPVLAGFLPFTHEWIYEGTQMRNEAAFSGETITKKLNNKFLHQKMTLTNEENSKIILQTNQANQAILWKAGVPGFYELEADGKKVSSIAVNINPEEFNTTKLEHKELSSILPKHVIIENTNQIIIEVQKARIGQEVTQYFVIIIFLLLFLEMALAQLKQRQGRNN